MKTTTYKPPRKIIPIRQLRQLVYTRFLAPLRIELQKMETPEYYYRTFVNVSHNQVVDNISYDPHKSTPTDTLPNYIPYVMIHYDICIQGVNQDYREFFKDDIIMTHEDVKRYNFARDISLVKVEVQKELGKIKAQKEDQAIFNAINAGIHRLPEDPP